MAIFCLALKLLKSCKTYVTRLISRIFSGKSEYDDLTDEEQYRLYIEKKNRELARKQSITKPVQQQSTVQYENEMRIIGFVEPIGKWTRLVMSEKRQRLAGLRASGLQNGFWQMLVSMKGMYQGKHKGRSR